MTMPQENPWPEPFFIILSRGTTTSELSGPISMSTTISKKMFLIKDNESTVSSEYIELIMKLFVLNCDIACVQSLGIDGSIKT